MTRTHTYLDRTGWAPGPWDGEPDHVEWRDPATGLPCLTHRNRFGTWCGYVGVPPGHPWHGKDYDDEALYDVDVHGGLTYADLCDPDAPPQEGICHVPEPGEPEDVWWLGFDCGHFMDQAPGLEAREREMTDPMPPMLGLTYRTLGFVVDETTGLAGQVARA